MHSQSFSNLQISLHIFFHIKFHLHDFKYITKIVKHIQNILKSNSVQNPLSHFSFKFDFIPYQLSLQHETSFLFFFKKRWALIMRFFAFNIFPSQFNVFSQFQQFFNRAKQRLSIFFQAFTQDIGTDLVCDLSKEKSRTSRVKCIGDQCSFESNISTSFASILNVDQVIYLVVGSILIFIFLMFESYIWIHLNSHIGNF